MVTALLCASADRKVLTGLQCGAADTAEEESHAEERSVTPTDVDGNTREHGAKALPLPETVR